MPIAGWYQDPENSTNLRWWDGIQWTQSVQPAAQVAPPAYVAPVQHAPVYTPPQQYTVQPSAYPAQFAATQQFQPYPAASAWKPPQGLALSATLLGAIGIALGWGIPFFGLVLGAVGLVLGLVALSKANAAPLGVDPARTGKTLAIWGVALSGSALVVGVFAFIIWAGINA
ncbi:DUF2510 domain-containing protein [Leifsonia sp. Leaf264]|uniref:DUF2510 domain-containing protein n=1 Tax=Leifsonia sp. Leaf264 TaxID=1736314 RepID=UPI0006FBDFD0|nr:DUF2510 domain-containing protein [Leifsonia sp. Leaf264]KQO98441.1 hypothetical protein ASF30_10290 [Leifsonia sp. Leaf264]